MASNMDGLSSIIGQLLSDPSAKEKLSQVINALSNTDSSNDTEDVNPEIIDSGATDTGFNLGDNDIITKAVNALTGFSSKNDPRINLLESLKPYMRSTRAGKIDLAVKVMQFSKIAPLFGVNLFGSKNPNE